MPNSSRSDDEYVRELNEAYNHFFFHYTGTPLLVVETSQFDLSWGDEALATWNARSGTWARARATTCRAPESAPLERPNEVSRRFLPLNSTRRWYMLQ